jgi:peptidoglycan hydrolase CwlO-like protein
MILVLLIAIVACGLVIRSMDTQLNDTASQIVVLQAEVSSIQNTMQASQMAHTQEIDTLNSDIKTLETLVNDLGLQVAN